MSGSGHDDRIEALDAAWAGQRRPPSTDPTPEEARALIDEILAGYGLDPAAQTNHQGWRRLTLGSAQGVIGVVERRPGEHYLVVLAPIMRVPDGSEILNGLHKLLLELNHDSTRSARFSLHDNVIYVGLTRSIRGLDAIEVDEAIRSVMSVADSYDGWLQTIAAIALDQGPLDLAELPTLKMTPQETEAVSALLAACDPQGREILVTLMERWDHAGHLVAPGTAGVELKVTAGDRDYLLACLRPGARGQHPLIVLNWEGLREEEAFPSPAVDRFQQAVLEITGVLQVTERTAHVEVDGAFDQERAKGLIHILHELARAAQPPPPEEPALQWDPHLPAMALEASPKTLARIRETLRMCPVHARLTFVRLMEGWEQAGGGVRCVRPGRIYLKLRSRRHRCADGEERTHRFSLAVLVAPKTGHRVIVDLAWGLARGSDAYLDYVPAAVAAFEDTVSTMPGFVQEEDDAHLRIDEAFQAEHAEQLLQAMVALRRAARADR